MEEPQIKVRAVDDFIRIMKGNITGGMWLALAVMSLIGITLSIYAQYNNSGKKNELSPEKWHWAYAIGQNIKRMLAGLLTMYVLLRFAGLFVNPSWLANEDLFLFVSLAVGIFLSFGVDKAIQWIQSKTNFLNMRNPYAEVKKENIEVKKENDELKESLQS